MATVRPFSPQSDYQTRRATQDAERELRALQAQITGITNYLTALDPWLAGLATAAGFTDPRPTPP